jgi:hypothetical protein
MPLLKYQHHPKNIKRINRASELPVSFPEIKNTFKEGLINRSKSLPLESERCQVIPISLIDDYIQSSDFADCAGNLGTFRQVLILRSRVKQRFLDSQIANAYCK